MEVKTIKALWEEARRVLHQQCMMHCDFPHCWDGPNASNLLRMCYRGYSEQAQQLRTAVGYMENLARIMEMEISLIDALEQAETEDEEEGEVDDGSASDDDSGGEVSLTQAGYDTPTDQPTRPRNVLLKRARQTKE